VSLDVAGRVIDVPASHEALAALEALKAARSPLDQPKSPPAKDAKEVSEKEALVIKPNEQEIQVEGYFAKRSAPPAGSAIRPFLTA